MLCITHWPLLYTNPVLPRMVLHVNGAQLLLLPRAHTRMPLGTRQRLQQLWWLLLLLLLLNTRLL
jgi:hypothetical protein